MRQLTTLSLGLLLVACGGARAPNAILGDAGPAGDGGAPGDGGTPGDAGPSNGAAPVTTANPPGETVMATALSVTLTSVPAATITYTEDGSDPTTSTTAVSGQSPLVVTLTGPAQITLTFFAKDAGGSETPHSQQYTLIDALQPASIAGQIIVPAAMSTGQAEVWLFNQNPTGSMPGAPLRVASVSLGTAMEEQYTFEGLPAGQYWVVGEWWPGQPMGNGTAYGLAVKNPITLDPATPAESRADFVNVYVGECDPAATGVDGNVVVGTDLLADTVGVASFTMPLALSGATMPSGFAGAVGTGSTRPFALCGLPPGAAYLLAAAAPPGAQNPTDYNEYGGNPLDVTTLQHVTLYIGAQDPTLGSFSGTVTLNGPLVGGNVQVAVSDQPWSGTSPVLGVTTLPGTSGTTYSYSLPSLPAGTYYFNVTVQSADSLSAYFPDATGISITLPATQSVTANLTGSDGRIQGTASLTGIPAGSGKVDIFCVATGAAAPTTANVYALGTATAPGSYSIPYVLFGLPDATYSVVAVVDEANTGDFTTAFNDGHDVIKSAAATVTAGSTASLSFTAAIP